MANCPICGRHLGTFTNDPILTTPSLSTDQYKGYTILLAKHIEEIQAERQQQEIYYGISPLTVFSPINIINFFQNWATYITELRSSTEKILVAKGMSLHDFLSTDEDGNPMTSKNDWTDAGLEEIKYQCKAIHIEDLRHFIQAGPPIPPTEIIGTEAWPTDTEWLIEGYGPPEQEFFETLPLFEDTYWQVDTRAYILSDGPSSHYAFALKVNSHRMSGYEINYNSLPGWNGTTIEGFAICYETGPFRIILRIHDLNITVRASDISGGGRIDNLVSMRADPAYYNRNYWTYGWLSASGGGSQTISASVYDIGPYDSHPSYTGGYQVGFTVRLVPMGNCRFDFSFGKIEVLKLL